MSQHNDLRPMAIAIVTGDCPRRVPAPVRSGRVG
jgi:hypothetical protein